MRKKKTYKTPFVLIETTSLMMWLQAFPCEQAHSPSPQSPHQSFQDFNQNEGKTPLSLKNRNCFGICIVTILFALVFDEEPLFFWFFISGVEAVRLYSVREAAKASALGFDDARSECKWGQPHQQQKWVFKVLVILQRRRHFSFLIYISHYSFL